MRQSPGALRRVCGFIHQAPGTDRASRPAAACAEGKASEKKKKRKNLKNRSRVSVRAPAMCAVQS